MERYGRVALQAIRQLDIEHSHEGLLVKVAVTERFNVRVAVYASFKTSRTMVYDTLGPYTTDVFLFELRKVRFPRLRRFRLWGKLALVRVEAKHIHSLGELILEQRMSILPPL